MPMRTRFLALIVAGFSLSLLGCLPVVAAGVLGILEALDSNSAPSLIVNTPQRSAGETVEIELTAFDADGDRVQLEVSYRVDDASPWLPATVSPSEVAASAGGRAHTLEWEAMADLGDVPGTDNYREGLQLRLIPDDGKDKGRAVITAPFAFGNNAPFITTHPNWDYPVRIDTEVDFHTDLIVIWFDVADVAGDSCRVVAFEISTTGGFEPEDTVFAVEDPFDQTGLGNTFPGGNLSGLASEIGEYPSGADAGTPAGITWDSRQTLERTTDEAIIRLQIEDEHGARSGFYESPMFSLVNQTPPSAVLAHTTMPTFTGERSGAVYIDYMLFDDESDICDVRIEYSTDNGQNWWPCTEFPSPDSEGVYDLASSPDGVLHRFVWDSTADLIGLHSNVNIRVTPADTFHPEGGFGDWTIAGFTMGANRFEREDHDTPGWVGSNQHMIAHRWNYSEPGAYDLIRTAPGGFMDPSLIEIIAGGVNFDPSSGSGISDPTVEDYSVVGIFGVDTEEDGLADTLLLVYTEDDDAQQRTYIARSVRESSGFTGWTIDEIPQTARDAALGHLEVGNPSVKDLAITTTDDEVWIVPDVAALDPLPGPIQIPEYGGTLRRAVRVEVGDVLSGGHNDIIISEAFQAKSVSIVRGLGSGTFDSPEVVPLEYHPGRITLADVSNNGELDLIVAQEPGTAGNQVAVLLNDGGVLSAPVTNPIDDVFHILTHDFNGNGQLEGVVARTNADHVMFVASDGAGRIAATTGVNVTFPTRAIAIGDFHGNGAYGVVTSSQFGTLSYLQGIPHARLIHSAFYPLAESINDAVAGDFNRNGHTDVFLATPNRGWLFAGNDDAQFEPGVISLDDNRYHLLASGDVTRNGRLDIVASRRLPSDVDRLNLIEFDEQVVATETELLAMSSDERIVAVAVGDMTDNGDPDILIAVNHVPSETYEIRILRNDDGTFTAGASVEIDNEVALRQLVLADFTGSGLLDLAVGTRTGTVEIHRNLGAASSFETLQVLTSSGNDIQTIATGDIFNNGYIDIFFTAADDTWLHGYRNVEGAFFGQQDSVDLFTSHFHYVQATDINEDGNLELIAYIENNSGDTLIVVMTNTGLGGPMPWRLSIGSLISEIDRFLIGDFARNGAADLVLLSNTNLSVLRGKRTIGRWNYPLTEDDVFGPDVLPAGDDRFDEPRVHHLGLRRFLGWDTAGRDNHHLGQPSTGADFLTMARNQTDYDLDFYQPLTGAWVVDGIQRFHRRPDEAEPFEYVLELSERFGPVISSEGTIERAGLDLEPSGSEPQRGVIIEIPIESEAPLFGDVHLLMRYTEWDVDESEFDFTDIGDPLERRVHHVEAAEHKWIKLQLVTGEEFDDNDLGPRYIIDEENGVIRILLDRNGILQAFLPVAS